MRSYPLHEARSKFSNLIDRALAGEPQRITRYGKEAVIIISEAAWNARPKSAPTLADLFANTIGARGRGGNPAMLMKGRWAKDKRPRRVDQFVPVLVCSGATLGFSALHGGVRPNIATPSSGQIFDQRMAFNQFGVAVC
jgi:prevent-host-death family protein